MSLYSDALFSMRFLQFDPRLYLSENYRLNYLYSGRKATINLKPKVVILDNNELSIACYLEDHPDFAQRLVEGKI